MQDKITKEKIDKYTKLTSKAISIVKENIIKGKEDDAKQIIEMVTNYLKDAKYFEEEKGDLVNAFAALNYAHGWIDAGVRLEIFNVTDDKLFTIR